MAAATEKPNERNPQRNEGHPVGTDLASFHIG